RGRGHPLPVLVHGRRPPRHAAALVAVGAPRARPRRLGPLDPAHLDGDAPPGAAKLRVARASWQQCNNCCTVLGARLLGWSCRAEGAEMARTPFDDGWAYRTKASLFSELGGASGT